ncbi:hypothetical protein FUAX_10180 [Fulvitalea axinellae]|uniref:DUF4421 domain-containing protein n=1 Tax=Fulvitalea axinellae TaxID=1182444 RepID=A0AAU9C8X7_9BACT|nr:hypothetical protein FUAX_10180 [Fulvitalea axinellae]
MFSNETPVALIGAELLMRKYWKKTGKSILFGLMLLAVLALNNLAVAQSQHVFLDSSYVVNYRDLFSVKLYGIVRSNTWNLKFEDQLGKETELKYSTNSNVNFGAGFSYRHTSVSYAFNLPIINNDNDRYGKTRGIDLQASTYAKRYFFDVYFSSLRGMYMENPKEGVFSELQGQPEIYKFPNMRSRFVGGDFVYVFNPKKYSLRSSFLGDERQMKSTGSFLLGVSASYSFLDNGDESILPPVVRDTLGDQLDGQRLKMINAGISVGYGYNLVIGKRFFFSLALLPGINYRKTVFTPMDDDVPLEKTNSLGIYALMRAGMGYNGKHLYMGVTAMSRRQGAPGADGLYDTQVSNQSSTINFFVGRRFRWNWLDEKADKLAKYKIPRLFLKK